jgi:hypothetical protein
MQYTLSVLRVEGTTPLFRSPAEVDGAVLPAAGFLPGGHVHGEHPAPQGLHAIQARRRLCLPLSLP